MDHESLAHAAGVVGALGAAAVLLARDRILLLGGLALVVAAEAGLGYSLAPDTPRLLTESTTRVAALAAVALLLLGVAAAFARFPAAAPIALLVVAPLRLPASLGNQEAFLLLPLYAILASAVLALAYRAVTGHDIPEVPLLVAGPAAALVFLAGVSHVWTRDPQEGAIELVFFYFPFAVLLAVVARTKLRWWSWRALTAAILAVTSLFAAIGIYQAWSHTEILAKQDVQLTNAYASFFRVTSVFQDPSVYGRYLVVGIVVVVALLWLALLRAAVGLPILVLLGVGLYLSYSQTSFVSLFVAVLIVALIAGDVKTRWIVGGVAGSLAVVAAVVVLVVGGGDSAKQVTSDRLPLARVTWPVYASHPVVGVGIGSQPLMSRREQDARRQKSKNVSHTTPLTVAAELGTLGLLAYLAFLVATARAILLAFRRHAGVGLALTGALTGLVVQSLFYGGFFEDPFVWGIAALAAAAMSIAPTVATTVPRAQPEWWAPNGSRPGRLRRGSAREAPTEAGS